MTIGTLGVVAAGAVAGLAVFKVASNSAEGARSAPVVAALPDAPAPVVPTLETLQPTDLPALPVVSSPAVTESEATQAVLDQAPGTTMSVRARSRQGYQSWAVQVQRPDGSIVTGYVDQSSGLILDWTTDRKATAGGSGSSSGDHAGAPSTDDGDVGGQHASSGHASSQHGSGDHDADGDDD